MTRENFQFHCPSCRTELSLPISMAGVTGPCPSCGIQIQAPTAAAVLAHFQALHQAANPAQAAYQAAAPGPQPRPQQPWHVPELALPPIPSAPPAGSTAAYPAPPPTAAPAPPPAPVYGSPAKIEPRLSRPAQQPPQAAPSSSPSPSQPGEPGSAPCGSREQITAQQTKPKREGKPEPSGRPIRDRDFNPHFGRRRHRSFVRRFLSRVFFPLLILVAAIALVPGLSFVIKEAHKSKPQPPSAAEPSAGDRDLEALETLFPDLFDRDPLSAPPTADQQALEDPPDNNQKTGVKAFDTLEQFLAASTLEERLGIIETSLTPEELATTPLAGPLQAINIETYPQELNPIEKATDFFYGVTFLSGNKEQQHHMMLVRTRGDGDPKIVVAPFLDLYGGRLHAFIMDPASKEGPVFHAIIRAIRGRVPEGAPEKRNMFTLKLLSDDTDNAETIGEVAVNLNSPVGRKYREPSPELYWGRATRCMIRLEWNRDDPQKPYLEALDIPRLDWNP